jgi:hypothetical protein
MIISTQSDARAIGAAARPTDLRAPQRAALPTTPPRRKREIVAGALRPSSFR